MRNILLQTTAALAIWFSSGATLYAANTNAKSEISTTISQCLPTSVKGLETVMFSEAELASAKADRNTILAGYTAVKNKLTITAFIYDRTSQGNDADLNEMRNAAVDILTFRNDAKLGLEGDAKIHIGGKLTDALVAVFFWNDHGTDYRSFLYLFPFRDHYLKLRVTYIQPQDDKGETTKYVRDMTYELAKGICQLEPKEVLTTQSR